MSDRIRDGETNRPYVSGKVVEVKGYKYRMEIEDEDNMLSPWINVPNLGDPDNPIYNMPKIGARGSALVDWSGDTGTSLGTLFNNDHPSPSSDPNMRMERFGSTTVTYDKGSGEMTIDGPAKKTITGGEIILQGDVKVVGTITCNGVNISDTHIHPESVGIKTGPPQ